MAYLLSASQGATVLNTLFCEIHPITLSRLYYIHFKEGVQSRLAACSRPLGSQDADAGLFGSPALLFPLYQALSLAS